MAAASPAAAGAATGFVGALAALAAGTKGAVLWIRQDMAARESGEIWAPGFATLGLDPARLVLLRAPDVAAALKAAEAGLSSAAVAAVVIEPFGAIQGFDRIAGRRLALAAGRSGALGVMLRLAPQPGAPAGLSAAETRWRLSPLSSAWGAAGARAAAARTEAWAEALEGWGRPLARAELTRNRFGGVGRWPLAWGFDDGLFRLAERRLGALDPDVRRDAAAAADPRDRAAGPADRPAAAPGAGGLRRAG
ncbi:DNA repair protein [Chenggangzhangella methanolivorans]|uniref:DNA repair protein n=1 Tax=Chenggangzhangella methanolivorans TaxID=1437009 RepID=A0A9E6UM40_9HYPH|nr:DNA repair protein [Chenggangzhangella methanolivorans]QZN98788.1 DNA repair protein [Chenggangzhangella methanolivorans]